MCGLTPSCLLVPTTVMLCLPLQEIFSTCLSPEQMRHLLHGPHTNFRASTTAGSDLPPQQPESGLLLGGLGSLGSTSSPAGGAGGSADGHAAAGRGHGRGLGRGRGGRGSSSITSAVSPAGKKPAASLASKQRGQGLKMFFQQTAKCLGCKQVIHTKPQQGSGPGDDVEPGLCENCAKEDGKRESVYISVVQEASAAAERFTAAHSSCRSCHSGGQLGGVVCENGECPVVYERFASERMVRNADHKLLRLDW